MNKTLGRAAFFIGLLAIGWVGAGYLRSNPLALLMTLLIAAFYLMGALELRRHEQATDGLAGALASLAETPARLGDWLATVPATLQHTVRLRIEGERVALPGPALTPYLTGLLVLLGMLGTFLGMVVTLAGTGAALERSTDLASMRDSLAAPVKGLGLAFGTSVAGVAASAMLGLVSALCRRERLQVAQALDERIATVLRPHTRAHQRDEALKLQQQQATLMPALIDRLQALAAQIDTQAQQSNERLLASQDRFQGEAQAAYRGLAASVDATLQHSLGESARIAAATIQPAVQATMAGLARESADWQGRIAGALQQQLDTVSARLESSSRQIAETWADALTRQAQTSEALAERLALETQRTLAAAAAQGEQQAATLQQTLDGARARLHTELAAGDEQRLAAWTAQLAAVAAQTEAQARGTVSEVARLVQTASEAPRAAAEVVAQLRDKLSDSIARDSTMLEERSRIMATLNTVLDAVQHTSTEQKAAIDALVASTADWLDQAGARFTQKLDGESARMDRMAAQLSASAVEVASLGEAFGSAVGQFSRSSDTLMAHLQRVDQTLGKSIERSDEQLAYYVAQAREVIDLSLASHKRIVDDLQRIAAANTV